jgi:outer membrane protein assembly complex protein YaeT
LIAECTHFMYFLCEGVPGESAKDRPKTVRAHSVRITSHAAIAHTGHARWTTGAAHALIGLLLLAAAATATEAPERLSPRIAWRVRAVRLDGAEAVPERALWPLLGTRARSRLTPWKPRPRFDRETLENDVARLAAYYRGRGYYRAQIDYALEPDRARETVTVTIHIAEGTPVVVQTVEVDVLDAPAGSPLPPLERATLVPLAPGDVFDEAKYDEGRARLLGWARAAHFARATVTKRATVDVTRNVAVARYAIHLGPRACFGPVAVEGLERVSRDVVLREVAFTPGAPFDPALLERTRRNLIRLRLFRSVTLREDESDAPEVAITIRVAEGPRREVRAGVGYDTEEEIRGLLAWRTYDFLGGARQLGFTARASQLRRSIAADFLQPHWPTADSRTRLLALFEDVDEDPFSLTQARLAPRLEWAPRPDVLVYGAYRVERDHLTSVPDAISRALPPDATPRYATLSGLNLGFDLNRTDDLLNPTRGWIFTSAVDPVGSIFGGDASFVRLQSTLRLYVPLPARLLVATRLRVGTITPVAGSHAIPIWERFYAGGIDSVRGYARWRVGPLRGDEPLGGRSLTDMSFELRRALTTELTLAAFIDAGQLSLKSFDPPVDDFQKGVGIGIQYVTPIGPIRLDLGFPLDRQGDDAAWQVYVSVGQAF